MSLPSPPSPPPFTPAQRDMQARGQNRPSYHFDAIALASSSKRPQFVVLGEMPEPDSLMFRERQAAVLAVLSDYARLSIQAAASGVSVAAKRYELEAILYGLERPAKSSKGKDAAKKASGRQSGGGGEGSGAGSSRR